MTMPDIQTDLLDVWYRRSEQVSPVRIRGLTRKRLAEHLVEFGLMRGAEIGVFRGDFSNHLLQCGVEHLLSVDPWFEDRGGDEQYRQVVERLARYGERSEILRGTSIDALRYLELDDWGWLDFVYIDGDHRFDYVMTDLISWARQVRKGGVVAGHDYYRFRQAGVVPAVDVYTQQHGITQWFLTDERTPTFFWVQEEDW